MNSHRSSSRVVSATIALAIASSLGSPVSAQSAPVITINGAPVSVNPAPVLQGGRIFVPLRGIFENLGASVVYDAGLIRATKDGREISVHLGSMQADVDGQNEQMDVAPFLIGDYSYVPLRFISQALGAGVNWDEQDQTVAITTDDGQQPQAQSAQPSYAQSASYEQPENVGAQYSADYISEPPPDIPSYAQPPVPEPDDIWQPGFWAFGPGGYYWVPGVWVPAPQPNYYWTPGYWGFHNGYFGYHPGYWATAIGFYGGIDYGCGYDGNGYHGGRWQGGRFHYNSAVTNVTNVTNITIIKNVYIDRTVVDQTTINHNTIVYRPGYNGGPRGVSASPTRTQIAVGSAPHLPPTIVQLQHTQTAGQDRRFLSSVNGGKPPILVVPHPFSPTLRISGAQPILPGDRARAQKLVVPVTPPAPTHAPFVRPLATPFVRPVVHPMIRPVGTPIPVRTYATPYPVVRPKYVRPPVAPAIAPVDTPRPVRPTPAPVLVRPYTTPIPVHEYTHPVPYEAPATVHVQTPLPVRAISPPVRVVPPPSYATPRPYVRRMPRPRPRVTPKPPPPPPPGP